MDHHEGRHILDIFRENLGLSCGVTCPCETRIAQGFQFLALSSGVGLMAKAASEEFKAIDITDGVSGDEMRGAASIY